MNEGDRSIRKVSPVTVVTWGLTLATTGPGLTDFTCDAIAFLEEIKARDGALFVFLRHTSASLAIQENADPDVRADLMAALGHLAPADAGWAHDAEGPDDMPAHVKAMLTGVSLHVPIVDGRAALGTWQGLYLIEHRHAPHQREVILQFIGRCQDE